MHAELKKDDTSLQKKSSDRHRESRSHVDRNSDLLSGETTEGFTRSPSHALPPPGQGQLVMQCKGLSENPEPTQGSGQLIQRRVNNTGLPDTLKNGIDNLSGYSIQMRNGNPLLDPDKTRQISRLGVEGCGGQLPHFDRIQSAFGHHDISRVRSYTNAKATAANRAINAEAYATGHKIAFRDSSPGLHTAAHEAAHIVQQRAGVHLQGGVGRHNDPYERHADAVADRVIRGESAESLLDQNVSTAGGGPVSGHLISGTAQPGDSVQKKLFVNGYEWTEEELEELYFAFDLEKGPLEGKKGRVFEDIVERENGYAKMRGLNENQIKIIIQQLLFWILDDKRYDFDYITEAFDYAKEEALGETEASPESKEDVAEHSSGKNNVESGQAISNKLAYFLSSMVPDDGQQAEFELVFSIPVFSTGSATGYLVIGVKGFASNGFAGEINAAPTRNAPGRVEFRGDVSVKFKFSLAEFLSGSMGFNFFMRAGAAGKKGGNDGHKKAATMMSYGIYRAVPRFLKPKWGSMPAASSTADATDVKKDGHKKAATMMCVVRVPVSQFVKSKRKLKPAASSTEKKLNKKEIKGQKLTRAEHWASEVEQEIIKESGGQFDRGVAGSVGAKLGLPKASINASADFVKFRRWDKAALENAPKDLTISPENFKKKNNLYTEDTRNLASRRANELKSKKLSALVMKGEVEFGGFKALVRYTGSGEGFFKDLDVWELSTTVDVPIPSPFKPKEPISSTVLEKVPIATMLAILSKAVGLISSEVKSQTAKSSAGGATDNETGNGDNLIRQVEDEDSEWRQEFRKKLEKSTATASKITSAAAINTLRITLAIGRKAGEKRVFRFAVDAVYKKEFKGGVVDIKYLQSQNLINVEVPFGKEKE
jgi:hypothetical protein